MAGLMVVLYVVFGVLCLVLFYKIWIMTNDVRDIKNILSGELRKPNEALEESEEEANSQNSFKKECSLSRSKPKIK